MPKEKPKSNKHAELISVEIDDRIRVRVDAASIFFENTHAIHDRIDMIARDADRPIVVSMSAVTFIDSAGIAMLVQLVNKYSKSRKLEFIDFTPDVRKTLILVKLEHVFDVI